MLHMYVSYNTEYSKRRRTFVAIRLRIKETETLKKKNPNNKQRGGFFALVYHVISDMTIETFRFTRRERRPPGVTSF